LCGSVVHFLAFGVVVGDWVINLPAAARDALSARGLTNTVAMKNSADRGAALAPTQHAAKPHVEVCAHN
jgi:hypothetical protein